MILRALILPPFHAEVLSTAEGFRAKGENEMAVIMAQTACELVTEAAFDVLIRASGVSKADVKQLTQKTFDLSTPRMAALYRLLSKDKIQAQVFWSSCPAYTGSG